MNIKGGNNTESGEKGREGNEKDGGYERNYDLKS
jgi:hypothetical protein